MSNFRLKVRNGEYEFEVESSDKSFVDEAIAKYLTFEGNKMQGGKKVEVGKAILTSPKTGEKRKISIVEFIKKLGTLTGTEKALAVSYYLEFEEKIENLNSRNIYDEYQTIRYNPSNPRKSVSDAKAQGLLMAVKGGKKGNLQVTESGMKLIEAKLGGNE